MSQVPARLQPLWPILRFVHRRLSGAVGWIGRLLGPFLGDRRLPRRAYLNAAAAAAAEPSAITLHQGPAVPPVERAMPYGVPANHWAFEIATHHDIPAMTTLEIAEGTVVGDLGAVITPGGGLEMESSEYWDLKSWRQHPVNLAGRLPQPVSVEGSLAVLAARGGGSNYYHFLLDVLPRMHVLEQCWDGKPDRWFLPQATSYQRELWRLGGWDSREVINSSAAGAIRAERLIVPNLPNHVELTPQWVIEWLRESIPVRDTTGKPERIYVTRGNTKNNRRYDQENEIWPELERRGFARVDPGTLSVQDQIDTFGAASTVVGIHGAALTNLIWSPPGVRVLHLMAPTFVKHCFHSITDGVPDSEYRYLLGDGPAVARDKPMNGLMTDISLDPAKVLAEVDQLL